MIQVPDIAVYSPNNELQLIVEVKNKLGATPEWAANMRRNLLIHSVVPYSPYFLLALPDYFYLWKDPSATLETRAPDYTANSKLIWESYLGDSSQYLDTMSEYSLELMTKTWLYGLTNAELTRETAPPHEAWLFNSGLYDAIKHGYVNAEATV